MGTDEPSYPLQSSVGRIIGYYIWQPYHPGSTVISQIAPAFAGIVLLMLAIMAALLVVLRLRSQKLQASEEHMNLLALHDFLTGLTQSRSLQ